MTEETTAVDVEVDADEKVDVVEADVIQRQKFSQQLDCKLTPQEISEAAEKLAEAARLKNEIADSKKTAMAQFKAQEDSAQADINRFGQLVRSKLEMRSVECEKVMDYNDGTVSEFRLDTGERLRKREMTEPETQMGLEL